MKTLTEIKKKLEKVFDEDQATVLSDVISDAYSDLVKTSDFNELKEIVRDIGVKVGELAKAQRSTEAKVGELAEVQRSTEAKVGELAEVQRSTEAKVGELADAQRSTEAKVGELADAQKESQKEISSLDRTMRELAEVQRSTEAKVGELADAQKESQKEISSLDRTMRELAEVQRSTEAKVGELADAQKEGQKEISRLDRTMQEIAYEVQILAKGLNDTRGELGGLSRSMSYAFENEAYRLLPDILRKKYGIIVHEKIIRAEIGGKEINIFGKAEKDGREVIVVGETKLRLDERRDKKTKEPEILDELEDKVKAVLEEYGKVEIVRVLITHYATKGFLKKAEENGIIVMQSFEW